MLGRDLDCRSVAISEAEELNSQCSSNSERDLNSGRDSHRVKLNPNPTYGMNIINPPTNNMKPGEDDYQDLADNVSIMPDDKSSVSDNRSCMDDNHSMFDADKSPNEGEFFQSFYQK